MCSKWLPINLTFPFTSIFILSPKNEIIKSPPTNEFIINSAIPYATCPVEQAKKPPK
jgi:hypothetical protein